MHEPLNVRTVEEAKSDFVEYWRQRKRKEKVSISKAARRVLAENVESQVDLPPFTRSVYDGFAVRAEDTFGAEEDNPVILRIVGRVLAGQNPDSKISDGECVEIATGAQIPEGADSVVMIEDTSVCENNDIEVRKPVSPGQNISEKGSELKKGDIVGSKGQKLTPQLYGALHACSIDNVSVFAKPKVGIISSGEELVRVGEEIGPGQIYDVNGPALSDAVYKCGAIPEYLGVVNDDFEEMRGVIGSAVDKYDVVITSGGSSAGSSDIVPEVIDDLGKPGVIVHGLAQKPGKPTILAVIDGKPIFGLPGYPVSALMEFDQIVAPYLREMSGEPEPELVNVQAKLTRKIISARGRRELIPISLRKREGEVLADPLREGSGAITSLAKADGYTVISIDKEIIREGENIDVKLFGGTELG